MLMTENTAPPAQAPSVSLPLPVAARASQRGFTLLEVMVSAGILAVVLGAAYGFMISFDNATRYNVKYYELYEQIQTDQIELDRLLTSAYEVSVTDGADKISGATRSITFKTISGFQSDGVTPNVASRTVTWTKTGTIDEDAKYKFDCDNNGKLEVLNIGKLTIDGVVQDDINVIEPLITLDSSNVITIVLKRINSQGYVAKRTLQATFNPSSEIIQ